MLFTMLTTFSLVLCIAVSLLWMRGHRRYDYIGHGRITRVYVDGYGEICWWVEASEGKVHFFYGSQTTKTEPPSGWNWGQGVASSLEYLDDGAAHRFDRIGLGFNRLEGVFEGVEGMVPIWLLAACLLLLPTIWAIVTFKKWARIRPGKCVNCGYDLLASPARCPECGLVRTTDHEPTTLTIQHPPLNNATMANAGLLDQLKFDASGLIPLIVQDADNGQVLMMAYMNRTAIEKTIETGKVHTYSRSRGRIALKGESSNHFQHVKTIMTDCDRDVLLIKVKQDVAACHEGYRSCFFREYDGAADDWKTIAERQFDPEEVYSK